MASTDVIRWASWFNDPEVLKYSVHRTSKASEDKQRDYLEQTNVDPTKVQFAICSLDDDLIGVISIQFDDSLSAGDISIIVGEKNYWGKGMATDAIHTIINYANLYHKTSTFTAGCDIRNIGSERSFLKNGFRRHSVLTNAAAYSDEEQRYDMVKLELQI